MKIFVFIFGIQILKYKILIYDKKKQHNSYLVNQIYRTNIVIKTILLKFGH